MPRDFVVDACSFKLFYDELIAETNGAIFRSIQKLLKNDVMIIDSRGAIRQEWAAACCGAKDEFLREWINNRILDDKIQERPQKRDNEVCRRVKNFGVPANDQKYIYLAKSNAAFAIISDDIDLYDPREKGRDADRVNKIKRDQRGVVCLYLRRDHGIEVFPIEIIDDFL